MMRILYENFQIFQFRPRILSAETIHGNTVDILVRNSYQLRNSVDNFVFSSFFQVEVESTATRNPPPETSSPEETPPRVHRVSSTENITVSNPGVSEDFDIIVPTGNQIVPTGNQIVPTGNQIVQPENVTSEDLDRDGSPEDIIVLTKNPIASNPPPASEDLERNGSTENIIVLTENTNVAIPSASEDFDRNGSTENLIVSTHDGSRIGDDEIVTVSEPEPTNMAELQKL